MTWTPPDTVSRRLMLKGTVVAGATLAGAWALGPDALAASAARVSPAAAATRGRVGATVSPAAYPKGTTWEEAMARFNHDVGSNFEVAKRYFEGSHTWPTEGHLGQQITSLVERKCRGLLCFKPALDGGDLSALLSSLKAIKKALPDAKITLYQEQGLGEKPKLTAGEFKRVYAKYQKVREVFPLFVDFAGSQPDTWADYRPAGVDGIAVDFYANAWHRGVRIDKLARWADEAGQEFGVWEMGNSADPHLPSKEQVEGYFHYLTHLQSTRLSDGHLVGDMAWFNGPTGPSHNNTISGTVTLSARFKIDRMLLDTFFRKFNGAK